MDNRFDLFKILKTEGKLQTILVYPATERINDIYEKTVDKTYLNPLPVEALIQQIGFSSLHYKYWGEIPVGSIQIITEKKNKSLMLLAQKIEYNNNTYAIYKDASKNFQYIERPDYCVFILGLQNA
jgi:hypothetical protein